MTFFTDAVFCNLLPLQRLESETAGWFLPFNQIASLLLSVLHSGSCSPLFWKKKKQHQTQARALAERFYLHTYATMRTGWTAVEEGQITCTGSLQEQKSKCLSSIISLLIQECYLILQTLLVTYSPQSYTTICEEFVSCCSLMSGRGSVMYLLYVSWWCSVCCFWVLSSLRLFFYFHFLPLTKDISILVPDRNIAPS